MTKKIVGSAAVLLSMSFVLPGEQANRIPFGLYESFHRPFSETAAHDSERHTFRGTTVLTSVYYDLQRFYHLNKTENLLSFSLSVGF
jgi:hypothetical protein